MIFIDRVSKKDAKALKQWWQTNVPFPMEPGTFWRYFVGPSSSCGLDKRAEWAVHRVQFQI